MAQARRQVERLIETDPVIKKGLQRRIINSRALARFIQEADAPNSTFDGILGIIRRYPISNPESTENGQVFRDCELSVRNKIADLQVEYHPDTMNHVAEFATDLKTTRGKNIKLIAGTSYLRVICDQKAIDEFRQTLRPRDIVKYAADLAEISIHLPPAAQSTKGIVAKITTELALNDINLEGIMEGAPELILLVAEADAPRALEALQRMLREETASPGRQITS